MTGKSITNKIRICFLCWCLEKTGQEGDLEEGKSKYLPYFRRRIRGGAKIKKEISRVSYIRPTKQSSRRSVFGAGGQEGRESLKGKPLADLRKGGVGGGGGGFGGGGSRSRGGC